MAVAEVFDHGGVVIRIHDDCCSNLSKDEIQRILRRIAAMTALHDTRGCGEKTG